jgi:hypothetical protein
MSAPRETNIRIRAAQSVDRRWNLGSPDSRPSPRRAILTLGRDANTPGCRQPMPLGMFGRGPKNRTS